MEHPLQLYSEYRHQFDVKRTNRGEERDPGVRNEHLQDFKKKIWEIRCHEWTNFLIKLDYKTTHRNLSVPLPFPRLFDPPKPLEVTAMIHNPVVHPPWASSFRFAPDNDSPRIRKPRSSLLKTSIIRLRTRKNLTCEHAADRSEIIVALPENIHLPPSKETGCSSRDFYSVSFIRWKRDSCPQVVFPSEECEFTVFSSIINETIFNPLRSLNRGSRWTAEICN